MSLYWSKFDTAFFKKKQFTKAVSKFLKSKTDLSGLDSMVRVALYFLPVGF